jgi:hypothetical protein
MEFCVVFPRGFVLPLLCSAFFVPVLVGTVFSKPRHVHVSYCKVRRRVIVKSTRGARKKRAALEMKKVAVLTLFHLVPFWLVFSLFCGAHAAEVP